MGPYQRDKFLLGGENSFDNSSSEEDEDCFDENNARMILNNSSIYEGVDRLKQP